MKPWLVLGILVAILLAAGWFITLRQSQNSPPTGEPERTSVEEIAGEAKTIMITAGIKHTVPLDEVISGGPPKDGIPSIDSPRFISVVDANQWLTDDEPGVAFSRGGTHRFYPYQILVWHEMVNDTLPAPSGVEGDGERVLVTYCPLCLTGLVFDPVVKGERVEFGTSGKLWKSNLVMYDRKTESWWSQILGEAIVGELAGQRLSLLPSDQVRYGDWKRHHPSGEVLSRDTGADRFYGQNPYGGYYAPSGFALRLAGPRDERLTAGEFVFGIVVGGKAKAYPVSLLKSRRRVEDVFQGRAFVLEHDRGLDVVRVFERTPSGELERINPFSAFWFSWSAAHPETEVYQ